MKNRCNNKNIPAYKKYGAKGTKCLWDSFEDFKGDMYESYIKHVEKYGERNTTIDRINVFGDYCKENCRWATPKEQGRNKRKNRLIDFRGSKLPVSQVAEILDKPYEAVYQRVVRKQNIEAPYREKERQIVFKGQSKTFREWERELGLPRALMYSRIFYKGWPVHKALSTPLSKKYSHKIKQALT